MRILASELAKHSGKPVTIAGWLHKKRLLGGLTFILVRDRSGLAQVKIEEAKEVAKLRNLQSGTVLRVNGKAARDKRAPSGVEIRDPKLEVLVPVTDTAPIEVDKPIDHTPEHLDTLFENRVVNLRNPTETGIFKVSAATVQAFADFFRSHGFTQVFTPKLLAKPTEGGAEVFKLEHFGETASLAQSPQFYKQMLVGAFERVFEIAPVYRAEPSATTRHMSEYISLDIEMGFIEGLDDLTTILSEALRHVSDYVWQNCAAELKALGAVKPKLPKVFPQITVAELHRQYAKASGQKVDETSEPSPAEERWVTEYALKKHKSEAIFITEFPAASKKFYHMVDEANPQVARRADLIFRGVELMTLSQREHRYDKLVSQLKGIGGDPKHPGFRYFLDAFKYGLPPHGGAGWGLERTVEKLVGLNNVKEATLFPRDMQRLTP